MAMLNNQMVHIVITYIYIHIYIHVLQLRVMLEKHR